MHHTFFTLFTTPLHVFLKMLSMPSSAPSFPVSDDEEDAMIFTCARADEEAGDATLEAESGRGAALELATEEEELAELVELIASWSS